MNQFLKTINICFGVQNFCLSSYFLGMGRPGLAITAILLSVWSFSVACFWIGFCTDSSDSSSDVNGVTSK